MKLLLQSCLFGSLSKDLRSRLLAILPLVTCAGCHGHYDIEQYQEANARVERTLPIYLVDRNRWIMDEYLMHIALEPGDAKELTDEGKPFKAVFAGSEAQDAEVKLLVAVGKCGVALGWRQLGMPAKDVSKSLVVVQSELAASASKLKQSEPDLNPLVQDLSDQLTKSVGKPPAAAKAATRKFLEDAQALAQTLGTKWNAARYKPTWVDVVDKWTDAYKQAALDMDVGDRIVSGQRISSIKYRREIFGRPMIDDLLVRFGKVHGAAEALLKSKNGVNRDAFESALAAYVESSKRLEVAVLSIGSGS